MDLLNVLQRFWPHLAAAANLCLAIAGSGHAVLYKRDPRAAVLWLGFMWIVPFVGPLSYFIFGVNRIRRRPEGPEISPSYPTLVPDLPPEVAHLDLLKRLVDSVAGPPLVAGNRVVPLIDGDDAFPAMLEAIAGARDTITLSTYIFDRGRAGSAFVKALSEAVRRGVDVRVLIDATGARYSWPSILPELRKAGVPIARFRPTFAPVRLLAINMRNHRKIMVVDGRTGFTGGINIRDGHLVKNNPRRPVRDMQFCVEGPVVTQLQEVFASDWRYATGEVLVGKRWFPPIEPKGEIVARGIADGPDEDFEKLLWTILGGLACARSSVKVLTPYFLPDRSVASALNLAAMRGVTVDIVLPEKNNLPFVQWATIAQLWQVLSRGCRVWLTPPPFDHSKLMVVDGCWSLVGSANWDPRSFRLNYEFNMECYDLDLARRLEAEIDARIASARQITLAQVDGRSLPIKLRDGLARLFSPYL